MLATTDSLGRVSRYSYDAAGNLTSATDAAGKVSTATFNPRGQVLTSTDALGRVTTRTYGATELLAAVTDPAGAKTTYGYDAAGRTASTTAPAGNVTAVTAETKRRHTTTYTYDAPGQLLSTRRVNPADPTKSLTRATERDALGRVTRTIDPTGASTSVAYDAAGNATAVTGPTGATTRATFDALSRPLTRTDAEGRVTTSTYDAAGNTSTLTAPGARVTRYTHTPDGRVATRVDPRAAVTGADPVAFTTRFDYDAAGNPTTITDPLGRTTTSAYDGARQRVKVTDPKGRVTTWSYDGVGRLATVTSHAGAVTSYAYDGAGQLTTRTEPGGRMSTFTYRPDGAMASQSTAAGRRTSYGYDVNGNRTSLTRPSGNATTAAGDATIATSYDIANRPTAVDYSDATADLAVTYDGAGRTTKVRQALAAGAVDTVYGYDGAGRTTSIGRGTEQASYTWNRAGQLTSRSYGAGRSFTYAYGADGLLARSTPATGETTAPPTTYTWDKAGQLGRITRPGGLTTAYTYDGAGQNTRLTHARAATTLVDHTVAYNASGDPEVVTTTRGAKTTSVVYDHRADQLHGVCRPVTGAACLSTSPKTTYTYDALGRRTRQTPVNTPGAKTLTYAYDNADELTTVTDSTGAVVEANTWTTDGQLSRRTTPAGTRTLAYGLDENLTAMTLEDGKTLGYTYDADGNRLNGAPDRSWVWDRLAGELGIRIGEYTPAGAPVHAWTPDPVSALGTAMADTTGTTPTWLLGDPLGNLTDTTTTAALTGTGDLNPFGDAPVAPTGAAAANPLRFHGQYLDDLTGLYDMRARDYNPARGAFTATDPLPADPTAPYTTTYHYARNTPLTLADPTGQTPGWLRDTGHGAQGAGEALAGTALQLWAVGQMTPEEIVAATADTYTTAYAEGGHGLAVNQFNPIYAMLVNGDRGWQLAQQGCIRDAAAAFTHTTLGATEVLTIGAGGLTAARNIATPAGTAAKAVPRAPQVIRAGDLKLNGVPKGAVGIPVNSGKGLQYSIPRGTPELHPNVTAVRIMDPVTGGKFPYRMAMPSTCMTLSRGLIR